MPSSTQAPARWAAYAEDASVLVGVAAAPGQALQQLGQLIDEMFKPPSVCEVAVLLREDDEGGFWHATGFVL